MRRREFITLLGGAAATWPMAARAQQPAMPVVGYLRATDFFASYAAAFQQGLKEMGYVEGQNVAIEYRFAKGQYGRLPELAADLVRRQAAVIHATDNAAALAAKSTTNSTPIVFAIGGDPVAMGLVGSLNRPGRNVTGVSFLSTDVAGKMLEVLHEVVPNATDIAALVNPANPQAEVYTGEVQEAARVLGLRLHILSARTPDDINTAFVTLIQRRAGALILQGDPFLNSRFKQLVVLMARHAIPTISNGRNFPDAGGLMSYGTRLEDAHRIAGVYAGRILKGEKPADLPVQQSTKFFLVVNLNTAKAIGLTIPEAFLLRADEVIE